MREKPAVSSDIAGFFVVLATSRLGVTWHFH